MEQQITTIRSQLATILIDWHKTNNGGKQRINAEILQITQPRMSNLCNMKLEKFSVQFLMERCLLAGLNVDVLVSKPVVEPTAEAEAEPTAEAEPVVEAEDTAEA